MLPYFWKSEKELFVDVFEAFVETRLRKFGSIDGEFLDNLIHEIQLLLYLGSDLYNEDWDNFLCDKRTPSQLAKAMHNAIIYADKMAQDNPEGLDASVDSLITLLDQEYCINGIAPWTNLAKIIQKVIRDAKACCTPYAYYYYLISSYKIELNKLQPINPFATHKIQKEDDELPF